MASNGSDFPKFEVDRCRNIQSCEPETDFLDPGSGFFLCFPHSRRATGLLFSISHAPELPLPLPLRFLCVFGSKERDAELPPPLSRFAAAQEHPSPPLSWPTELLQATERALIHFSSMFCEVSFEKQWIRSTRALGEGARTTGSEHQSPLFIPVGALRAELLGTLDPDGRELKKSICLGAFKWPRHDLGSFAYKLVSGSATIRISVKSFLKSYCQSAEQCNHLALRLPRLASRLQLTPIFLLLTTSLICLNFCFGHRRIRRRRSTNNEGICSLENPKGLFTNKWDLINLVNPDLVNPKGVKS
ncbi:hypothetical protein KFK09_010953 [Dendrobium nobile]|uniref:Uncharacterized protein n=1 Tax=Dendrobium nobile TaxID=94219 RepID=A0A8T3BBD1_DENNO|nr:hypothetical protein KFK09_010953 [Dendrobium nobile]